MSLHVFGAVVTYSGVAANNRGETEGNITTLQKLLWNGEVHSTVSAEAIRWAIRYYWQKKGIQLNRQWDDDKSDHGYQDEDYRAWDLVDPKGDTYCDDDVLGFMEAAAANEESEFKHEIPRRRKALEDAIEKKTQDAKLKKKLDEFEVAVKKLMDLRREFNRVTDEGGDTDAMQKEIDKLRKKAGLKAGAIARRGVLEIARAISTRPFAGDITFNARSGKKGRTSLYGTEIHATRYQYGFALTPERLRVKTRAIDSIDAITNLGEVAGNQSRFLFDFSPESIVLRISEDAAPRILYCFQEDEVGNIKAPDLVRRVQTGDILASEIYIGGPLAENPEVSELSDAHVYPGVKSAVTEFLTEFQTRL